MSATSVELRHTPNRVKHEPKYSVEESRATFGARALQFEQRESWIVRLVEDVGTIRASIPLPLEKATCGYAVRCIWNTGDV